MSCKENQNIILKDFSGLNDWEAKYRKIIDLGKSLAPMAEELKTPEKLIKGCQSQVWMHAHLNSGGLMQIEADSDALIVKGLVAILVKVYSNCDPYEVLQTPPDFLKELGLEGGLTPSRANGLHAMLNQIKNFAIAFHYLKQQQKKV